MSIIYAYLMQYTYNMVYYNRLRIVLKDNVIAMISILLGFFAYHFFMENKTMGICLYFY